ncbi:MAG: hypothetical protein COA49_06440 [Bacteroidetes bacterium]|nr:MAG: hypothetical protein COA49_06440 [Bacteroidota bacterium]
MSRILIAVLNWGLGHATRTLPIIEGALDLGWSVDVASAGDSLVWLERRLIERGNDMNRVAFFEKPGRIIEYSENGTMLKIVVQTPGLITSIIEEKKWTAKHVKERGITKIFSDNCYGSFHPDVESILMTHVLRLPVSKILRPFAQSSLRYMAGRFNEVWVPDVKSVSKSISGGLTSKSIHRKTKYVGVLSRFDLNTSEVNDTEALPLLVGIVSGPEPHRSFMEKGLREWMSNSGKSGVIIAGKPDGGKRIDGKVTTLYDTSDIEIQNFILRADTLICRSGYSTLLDLVALRSRAILIPTPGQAEQEELAILWKNKFGFSTCSQADLELINIPEISGKPPDLVPNRNALNELAAWLKN